MTEFDPLAAYTEVVGCKGVSPSDCHPNLWCRTVGSRVWESLGEQGCGDPLVHLCCSQCKASTAGLRRNADGPKSPFPRQPAPTMQMVFCGTEDLTKSSAGVI